MSRGLLAPYQLNRDAYDTKYQDYTKFQNNPNFKAHETQLHKRGTRYPGSRRGLGSLMEGGAVKTDLLERQAKFRTGLDDTEPGVYRIKLCKNDAGEAADGGTINIAGKIFKANDKGMMKIIDPESTYNRFRKAFRHLHPCSVDGKTVEVTAKRPRC